MSPTLYKNKNYRILFFSREESRIHVHVLSPDGEAKFWIEPVIALANYTGFKSGQIKEFQKFIEEHQDEIICSWKKYFNC